MEKLSIQIQFCVNVIICQLVSKLLLSRGILTSCILLIYTQLFAQTAVQIRNIDSIAYLQVLDSLEMEYATNKVVLPQYSLATYIALSHYPELVDAKIEFKTAKIKTTLNARPSVASLLFRSKLKRKYVIRINSQIEDSIISFNAIPFNAKVGVLGHEFAHILDYQQRNFFQVLGRMFAYAGKKSKAKFEHEIDGIAIDKGFGWQLYDWSTFVLEQSNATAKYKAFKREIYLTPAQIQQRMEAGR